VAKFAYVVNANNGASGSIGGYTVDSYNGSLSGASGAEPSITGPASIAAHPNNKLVYVGNQSGTIGVYAVNRDAGNLSTGAGSTVSVGAATSWIGVTSDGKYLYTFVPSTKQVVPYSVNSSSGALTALTPVTLDGTPARGFISPNLKFVYATLGTAGTEILSIGSDGNLTKSKTVAVAPCASVSAIVLDPQNRYAFVADGSGSGGVCNYKVNAATGDLTLITPTMYAGGSGAVAIALNPATTVLLVANSVSNNVSFFLIGGDGSLGQGPGTPLAAGQSPSDVVIDPAGSFAYVTNSMENTLTMFQIGNGKSLTRGGTWTTGANPVGIAVIQ